MEKLTNVTPCSNSRRIGTLHILKTIGLILQHKWIMLKILFCHTSGKSAVHRGSFRPSYRGARHSRNTRGTFGNNESGGRYPRGLCWSFNRDGFCKVPNCRFSHKHSVLKSTVNKIVVCVLVSINLLTYLW